VSGDLPKGAMLGCEAMAGRRVPSEAVKLPNSRACGLMRVVTLEGAS
jgi:hypothetical protein